MKKSLWPIAAGIVFGVSLIAQAPARLFIPDQSGKLRLLGIGGSIWRGEVKQILFSGKALPVRDLNWTVNPIALLTGTLEADVGEQQSPTNRGTVGWNLRSRQLEVQALNWEFSGDSLDPWFQSWIGLRGQFVLDLQTLRFSADRALPSQLDGRLDWHSAELRISSETWPVGSPVIQFSGGGGSVSGVLTNSQPLLPGDGSFQCSTKSCRVDLNLRPIPDAPQSLLNGLMLLGLQQTGDGFSGQIILPVAQP